jgi:predicted DsbA family dithiol-disulfide isomerase
MRIQLWADVACPWCYIGLRRLRRSLQETGLPADIRWRPFLLEPSLPRGGILWSEFVPRRFGGWAQARTLFGHLTQMGAQEGIRFDFESIATATNTTDAHRVILHAQREGMIWPMAEAMFAAYFSWGRDIGDPDVLADIAASAGLARAGVKAMLESDDLLSEVRAGVDQARRSGIGGVPFVVIEGGFVITGAQPLEEIRATLERAADGRETLASAS